MTPILKMKKTYIKIGYNKKSGFQKGHRDFVSKEARKRASLKTALKLKGRVMSEEQKKAISETKKKSPTVFLESWREEQSERLKLLWSSGKKKGGWKHTEEWKLQNSIRNKGKKYPNREPLSEETKKKISESHKGEKAYQWITDRTQLKKSDRNGKSSACTLWRMEVRTRDGNKCKIANKDCKGQLEVHHILRWADFPELRYDINNGITLCHFHHPRKKYDENRLSPYFRELVLSDNDS